MANQIQFKRTTTSAVPPATLKPGEPAAVLDTLSEVALYVGDSASSPVLVNPAPTPIGGLSLSYKWDTDTTATDPGVGTIKINGTQASGGTATLLFVNEVTGGGNNFSVAWEAIEAGDFIGIFENNSATGELLYWRVTGPSVDNGGWFTIPGDVIADSGDAIDNNKDCSVFLIDRAAKYIAAKPAVGTNQTIEAQAAVQYPLSIKGFTAQTAHLLRFQSDSGTELSGIDKDGNPDGMLLDGGTF